MALNFSKAVAAAASTGLIIGSLAACDKNRQGASAPSGGGEQTAAAGEKACCKGQNECKGKGGCAVEGKHGCAGSNECKGKGGCNGHCPK
jgi:hypothetical protein